MAQQCSHTKVAGIDFSFALYGKRRKSYATYEVTYHKGVDTQPKITAGGTRCDKVAVLYWTWSIGHKRYHKYYCATHTPKFPTSGHGNLQQGAI
jgi:hypothetical protein